MLHTIQVDDVIPIVLPLLCVGWLLQHWYIIGIHTYVFPKDFWNIVCELCLMLGGIKMWLDQFYSLVLTVLYSLVTGQYLALCRVSIRGSYESLAIRHWEITKHCSCLYTSK